MVRVAVIGATGYTGQELVALLARHPGVEVCALQGSAGRKDEVPFAALHPQLRGRTGPACTALSLDAIAAARPDFVLLATPNESSAELAAPLLGLGLRVLDLSGAFRLSEADYPAWYGFTHPQPALLARARYAVPELLDDAGRAELRRAQLIANPGCYATAVTLALAPLVPLVHPSEAVIVDAASGVSGAGKRAEVDYSFTELAGNMKAYAVAGHRHAPEIRRASGLGERAFVFVPHLIPVARGILATLHVPLAGAADASVIAGVYQGAFGAAPLVGVRPAGQLPQLTDVVGTPRCEIGFQVLDGGRRLVVLSALDNLQKGAASQAVQNLNLACGLPETAGLT